MSEVYYDDSPNGVSITDEPIQIKAGRVYLKHHHDSNTVPMNVTIYTQTGKQGTQIGGFTVKNDDVYPYLKYIEFDQATINANPGSPTVYANYTGTGQYINAALWNSTLQRIADLESGAPVNQAPSIPTSLSTSNKTTSGFRLSWSAATDPESNTPIKYNVYKNDVIYQSNVSNAYLDITGQAESSTATWKVSAVDSLSKESAKSTGLSVTINTNQAPSIPVSLSSTNVTTSGFRLNWAASTDTEGEAITYRVFKDGVQYSVPTSNTYMDIVGQAAGSSANWTVTAIDATSHESLPSSALPVIINTVTNNPPSVPTGLAESNKTTSGFRLSWNASTDSEGNTPITYQVYKGGVAYGSPTSNLYLDITGQTAGSTATWTVSAIDSGSRASNQSSGLPVTINGGANNPPSVPTGLNVLSWLADGFVLGWTASTDAEGDTPITYNVYKGGTLYQSGVSTNQLSISGQPNGTSNWSVSAVDSGSRESTRSADYPVLVTVNQAPTASPTITGTTTVGSVLTVNVNYADAEGNPAGTHLYQWYRDTQSNGATKVAISGATSNTRVIAEADVGKYLLGGVVPKATSGTLTGVEAFSSGLLIPVPAPPSITVTAGDAQNTISFSPNTTLATETYNLYWSTTQTTAANIMASGTKVAGVGSNFSHNSLTNGTQYNYVLTMVVNGVESSPSAVQSGTPIVQTGTVFTFNGSAGAFSDPYFTILTAGSGTVELDGSGNLAMTNNVVADGTLAYRTNSITRAVAKRYRRKVKFLSGSSPTFTSEIGLGIMQNATKKAPDINANWATPGRIAMVCAPTAVTIIYINTSGQVVYWTTASGGSWTTGAEVDPVIALDTQYWFEIETTATGFICKIKNANETTTIVQTTEVPWSSVKDDGANNWVYFGDRVTDYHTGKSLTDQFEEI